MKIVEDEVIESEGNKVPWKSFLIVTGQTCTAFYVATLCLVMFLRQPGPYWLSLAIFMGICYLTVLVTCVTMLVKRLSIATLMLMIPIAPLLALIMVLSFIPLLQYF